MPCRQTANGSPFHPTRTGYRAGGAARAAPLPFGFLGAATGAAALGEYVGEFAELDLRFVEVSQLLHHRRGGFRNFPQEVKEQTLAIKEMFDVDQHGGDVRFGEQVATGVIGFVAVFFEPRGQQIVFDRDPPQDLTVGSVKLLGGLGQGENFADFQAARAPDNHPRVPWVARGVDGREAAHMT